ncbi:MAG: aminopeptidase [Steroidobacterales bacterium]
MNINSIPRRLGAVIAVLGLAVPIGGCYELQAIGGQISLLRKRESIAAVIANPATPAPVRAQLQAVSSIREFASRELGLPDNGSYRSYADIGRSYVVWNVFAAPEFSVEPRRWCYPVVGCVAYRGYFAERDARRIAGRLREAGYDVAVGGASAYSTLGTFDDPVLNTMLGWSDVDLAGIIFHELTHQLLYVADDASFNEALATLVEQEGVRRWLLALGRERDFASFTSRQQRYAQVTRILRDGRADLQALYASGADRAAMRDQKRLVFENLRREYQRLRAGWPGDAGFDAWFDAGLNNAQLASVATYQGCLPGLAGELAVLHGDLPAFYKRVKVLAQMPAAQRDALICN